MAYSAQNPERYLKKLILSVAFTLTGAAHAAGVFECKVLDAAFKAPGKARVESASNKDARILGEVFTVRARLAEVTGSLIYRTERHKVEVLRASEDQYSLLIRDAGVAGDDDVSLITLERFEGRWSFKHYSSWLGLLTSGSCQES